MELKDARGFAWKLREARVHKGMTQQELADQIGMSRSWVHNVETGRKQPTLGAAIAALSALDYTLEVRKISQEERQPILDLLERLGR